MKVVLCIGILLAIAGCKCSVSEQDCLDELNAVQQEHVACVHEMERCVAAFHAIDILRPLKETDSQGGTC